MSVPPTVSNRWRILEIVACFVLMAVGCRQRETFVAPSQVLRLGKDRSIRPEFLQLVRADQYELISNAMLLPDDVKASLAREVGESRLEIASELEPFNGGCVMQPGVPRRRLLLAAVSPRFAVVHFEQGGFAIMQNVLVFQRSDAAATTRIWANIATTAWSEPDAFLTALRSGALFRDVNDLPGNGT